VAGEQNALSRESFEAAKRAVLEELARQARERVSKARSAAPDAMAPENPGQPPEGAKPASSGGSASAGWVAGLSIVGVILLVLALWRRAAQRSPP
jgi:hypothetical protein